MVERWANLLASAAGDSSIEPIFVSILGEISGKQVVFLRELALNRAKTFKRPYLEFERSYLDDTGDYVDDLKQELRARYPILFTALEKYIRKTFNSPGQIVDVAYIDRETGGRHALDVQFYDELDFDSVHICASLGLLAREVHRMRVDFAFSKRKIHSGELNIIYYRMTLLGQKLIRLCDPNVILKLEKASN